MKTERVPSPLRVMVPWLALFLLAGCMPRMTLTQTAHYSLYENLTLTLRGDETWTKTAIHIPKGAIVAFMAEGQIWDSRYFMAYTEPYSYLWLKIGKDGRGTPIFRGATVKKPLNMNVIKAESDGFLYYWIAMGYPQSKVGNFSLNVIVWPEDQEKYFLADCDDLARSHPDRSQYRYLPTRLAYSLIYRGDYSKAEALLRSQRESPAATALDFILSSRIERQFGRNELARTYAERALGLSRREANERGQIVALSSLAWATSNLGNHKEAIRLEDQGLLMAKRLGEEWFVVDRHLNLGGLYLRADNPKEAERHCEEVRAFINTYGDRSLNGPSCYLCLGRAQSQIGNQVQAKKSFKAALAAATQWGFSETLWQAHDQLGRIAEKEGDNREAFTQYAEAIKVIEGMRGKLSDSTLKTLFTERRMGVYERMIYLLIRMQRDTEALEYIERCKGRALLDMLQEKAFSSRNREENELLTEERALAGKIEQISRGLEKGVGGEPENAEDRSVELSILRIGHRAVLERIESLNAELASLLTTRPLKPQEIQALLDPDVALLEYFVGEQGARLIVVTRDRVLAFPLAAGPEKLARLVATFRTEALEAVYRDGLLLPGYDTALTELHDILIGPATLEIRGKRHLVIVPHGVLHYIPFHALISKKGSYLLESFSVSYLPSASVLPYVQANNKGNHTALFAAANPNTDLAPLPAAEAEAREVRGPVQNKARAYGLPGH